MKEDRSQVQADPQPLPTRNRWPVVVLTLLAALLALTVLQRNRIRAHWWATRLQRVEGLSERTYYLSCLASVGDSAEGPVRRLARHPRAEVRALAVPAMVRLSERFRFAELDRMLGDPDAEVRQSAALALAFAGNDGATAVLARRAAGHDAPASAAAATAALSRVASPGVLAVLCKVAGEHPGALVRAQAVESIGAWLTAERVQNAPVASHPDGGCEPFAVLVSSLADRETFKGLLALEQELARAELAAGRMQDAGVNNATLLPEDVPATSSASGDGQMRTVADVAAQWLSSLADEEVYPGNERSVSEQAELADRCRRAWAAREPATLAYPADSAWQEAPSAEGETPPDTSSDTNPG